MISVDLIHLLGIWCRKFDIWRFGPLIRRCHRCVAAPHDTLSLLAVDWSHSRLSPLFHVLIQIFKANVGVDQHQNAENLNILNCKKCAHNVDVSHQYKPKTFAVAPLIPNSANICGKSTGEIIQWTRHSEAECPNLTCCLKLGWIFGGFLDLLGLPGSQKSGILCHWQLKCF